MDTYIAMYVSRVQSHSNPTSGAGGGVGVSVSCARCARGPEPARARAQSGYPHVDVGLRHDITIKTLQQTRDHDARAGQMCCDDMSSTCKSLAQSGYPIWYSAAGARGHARQHVCTESGLRVRIMISPTEEHPVRKRGYRRVRKR